jgi:hypothetical protein
MLLYGDAPSPTDGPTTLQWRNLATRAHGTATSTALQRIVAAAPSGWVYDQYASTKPHADVLYLQTVAGKVTKLGAPDPDGDDFGVVVGGSTLVAFTGAVADESNGTARVISLTRPGKFHLLVGPNGYGRVFCASATSTRVALLNANNTTDSERLYSTTGKLLASTSKNLPNGVPAVLGDSLAWVNTSSGYPPHRLRILTAGGHIATASGRYDGITPVAAFGKIIATAQGKRELILISSAKHRRVFVAAGAP